MKQISLVFLSLLLYISSFSQQWTDDQLDSADTGKDVAVLSEVEKETIMYINLARLYPQLFVQIELINYAGPEKYGDYLKNSSYKKSLVTDLQNRKPMAALTFDQDQYDLATCFSKELGESGAVTHKRKNCSYGYLGECCSFGMETGEDIAMQWLIDDKVGGMGHRINCLNKAYSYIGVSFHLHKKYRQCAVADFR